MSLTPDTPINEQLLPDDDIYAEIRIVVMHDGRFLYKGPENSLEFNGMCQEAVLRNRERLKHMQDKQRKQREIEEISNTLVLTPAQLAKRAGQYGG